MRATEKLQRALPLLLEGLLELRQQIESDYVDDLGEEEADEFQLEIDAAIVTETRAAIEAFMDEEDYGTEEVALAVSQIAEALAEIDPDVFEEETSQAF